MSNSWTESGALADQDGWAPPSLSLSTNTTKRSPSWCDQLLHCFCLCPLFSLCWKSIRLGFQVPKTAFLSHCYGSTFEILVGILSSTFFFFFFFFFLHILIFFFSNKTNQRFIYLYLCYYLKGFSYLNRNFFFPKYLYSLL